MSEQFDKLYDEFLALHWYTKFQRMTMNYYSNNQYSNNQYSNNQFDLPDEELTTLKTYCYSNMIACLPAYDDFIKYVEYIPRMNNTFEERAIALAKTCKDYNLKCDEDLCYHIYPYMDSDDRTAIVLYAQILLYENKEI